MVADAPPLPQDYWLGDARVPPALLDRETAANLPREGAFCLAQVHVQHGRIAAIEPALPASAQGVQPLGRRLLASAWVDAHTHLDKTGTAARIGTSHHALPDAVRANTLDRARWTAEDVRTRMAFALACAWAHGTRALRTHLDWVDAAPPVAWPVARALRDAWAGRIELQLVSICPLSLFGDLEAGRGVARALAQGGGVLGASVHPMPGQRQLLERVFELAKAHRLALDFHVDEHLQDNAEGMRNIAELTLRHGMQGRVVCGHCCSLVAVAAAEQAAVLQLLHEAGITLVSLPLANLQLQDGREAGSPRLRGIAPLREAHAAGVPVCIASDNVRDAFVPFGDYDLRSVLATAALAAHLDNPLADWISAVTTSPARALGLAWDGVLRRGAPADLLVLGGRDSFEACTRPVAQLLRAGQRVETSLPEFAQA